MSSMQARGLAAFFVIAMIAAQFLMSPSTGTLGDGPNTRNPYVEGQPSARTTARTERVARRMAERAPMIKLLKPQAGDKQPVATPHATPTEVADGEPSLGAGGSVWPATPDGIVGAIKEAHEDLRSCYGQALQEIPELTGNLVIKFTLSGVDGVGRMTDVYVQDGALEDVPMEDCVLDAFELMEFDPPADGDTLEVNYPLSFEQEE
jgi:hypothetical protein